MQFNITHHLTYHYDKPVKLIPLTVRMKPKHHAAQSVMLFDMIIDPKPVSMTGCTDHCGNELLWVGFQGKHAQLSIRMGAMVKTLRHNPFDFIVRDMQALTLPLAYSQRDVDMLIPYIATHEVDPSVRAYAIQIQKQSHGQLLSFLSELTAAIHQECAYTVRKEGPPWKAVTTLRKQQGSCRDLAVLFIECCRVMGVAARFVSGYSANTKTDANIIYELHAWVEVYIPDVGWRGYDPSLGLVVADQHVMIAAGPDASYASPTEGGYYGKKTSEQMEYHIHIEKVTHRLKTSVA